MDTNGMDRNPVIVEQSLEMFVHAAQQVVQFRARGRLELNAHDTFVPFAVLEAAYFLALQIRLQRTMPQLFGGAVVPSGVPVAQ